METISNISVIFDLEQLLDSELFWLQVIESEKFKSIVGSFENVVVGAHHSLYRIYRIYYDVTDMIHLLLFLLIPHYQFFIIIDP